MRFSTLRIAWRNLGRNRRRTALAVLAIGVGQWALVSMTGILHGQHDNIRLAITGPMVGHAQIHAPDWREERAMDLMMTDLAAKIEAVRADEAVMNAGARVYAPVLAAPEREAYMAVVMGVDLEVETQDFGLLSGMAAPLGPQEVLVGSALGERMGIEAGQEIALVGQGADGSIANDLYIVRDIIRSPSSIVNDTGVVMSLEDAQTLFVLPNQAHEIVIRTKQAGQAEAMCERLRAVPALAQEEVLPWQDLMPEFVIILSLIDKIGYLVLILLFIAAVAGVANTLMMSTFERMHEIGMLLALGSRPARIVRMIFVEAVLLGVLGVAVGSAAGIGFVGFFGHTGIDLAGFGGPELENFSYKGVCLPMHVHPRMEAGDVLLGLVGVTFTALVAAVWPAMLAARLEPMEAMRA